MRDRGRGGDGGRDWGNIDWSNIDLSGFGRGTRVPGPSRRAVLITALLVLLIVIPLFIGPIVGFLIDLLWFRSLGLEAVYLRRFTAGFYAFAAFAAVFFVLALPNLYFALRPQMPRVVVDAERRRRGALSSTLRYMWLLLIPAFFFGLAGGDEWDMLLRYVNQVPFGTTDPVFGRDIGFYFFTLPVLEFVRGWLLAALIVIAIGVITLYFTRGVIGVATGSLASADLQVAGRTALALARPARAHLSIIGGLFLALIAGGYFLDRFDLLFRQESVLVGAGYTSITARLPALTILSVLVGIAALACFANAFRGTLWILGGAIVLWFAATLVVGNVYPALIQNFIVAPDQLNKERPYILRNIAATRAAYSLDSVDESAFNVADTPTPAEIRATLSDTATVRLWDYRPLQQAFDQLQALRQYYAFNDVDIDRYQIGGKETPLMLSARELSSNSLPQQTWVNRHLVFTHGLGAVATAVGAVGAEGRPLFSVKDIPPTGEPKIDQPRIYYGELTGDYVVVDTNQDEFDYTTDQGNVTTRFSGNGGISVGSLWDRLLFTIRFGDTNLLVSNQITGSSKVLFRRQILPRERFIAPFLEYDPDPYLVIANGKLYWMNDAFTTGDHYPYSESFNALGTGPTSIAGGRLNYVRNSVKVVTDAYDGTISYYVIDEKDPVIRNLRSIYPSLFKSIADMPQALRDHIRYPEALFSIQSNVFALYHMTNPDDFYNRTDAWKIASEVLSQGGVPQPIEPYYVTTRLPGSERPEFVLFVPMTPAGGARNNMVGWIAGRADAPEYGKLRVLTFPRDRPIAGPLNVETRIDADSTIRQQLTLLCGGGGASCLRGNLLVLPVGNSFLYVEALFVQATSAGRIPELQRVIIATQDKVAMAPSFELALDAVFGQVAQPPPPPPTTTPPTTTPPTTTPPSSSSVATLVKSATDHYNAAQAALKSGDFAEYGRQLKLLEDDLTQLRAATGQ